MPIANECEYRNEYLTSLADSLIKRAWVYK